MLLSVFAVTSPVPNLGHNFSYLNEENNSNDTSSWNWNDGIPSVELFNRGGYIGLKAHVGNPPQTVELMLDTGSDTSWVNSPENPYCRGDPRIKTTSVLQKRERTHVELHSLDCDRHGTFDLRLAGDSVYPSTYNSKPLHIRYVDSTTVDATFYMSNFTIGHNLSVPEFEFGVSKSANSSFGVLAVSPPDSSITKSGEIRYRTRNYIRELQKSNNIERSIFAVNLNLDDYSKKAGSLLLGGIDQAKFTGPMLKMKIVKFNDGQNIPPKRYRVLLSNVLFNDTDNGVSHDLFSKTNITLTSAIFDTGSRLTYIPGAIYEHFIKLLPNPIHMDRERYIIECDQNFPETNTMYNQTIGFKFGTYTGYFPLKAFLHKYEFTEFNTRESARVRDAHGNIIDTSKSYCQVAIGKGSGPSVIFGHDWFRQTYTVFDLDRMEVSWAPSIQTPKSRIKKLKLSDDIEGVEDGWIEGAEESFVLPEMYHPAKDFIPSTHDGYYKQSSASDGTLLAASTHWKISIMTALFMLLV